MKNPVHKTWKHRVPALCVVALGAVACTVGGSEGGPGVISNQDNMQPPAAVPALPPKGGQAGSAGPVIEVEASRATIVATGVALWRAHKRPDGSISLEGTTSTGELRTRMLTGARSEGAELGELSAVVFDKLGAPKRGAVHVKDGKVVANTLPAGLSELAEGFRKDYDARPVAFSSSSCSIADEALVAALISLGIACGSTSVPACIAAAVAADAAARYDVQECNDCPCPSGYQCTQGDCTQVQSSFCVPCEHGECGWDYSCGAPEYCTGGCSGGGGGGGSCNEGSCWSDSECCSDYCDWDGWCS